MVPLTLFFFGAGFPYIVTNPIKGCPCYKMVGCLSLIIYIYIYICLFFYFFFLGGGGGVGGGIEVPLWTPLSKEKGTLSEILGYWAT